MHSVSVGTVMCKRSFIKRWSLYTVSIVENTDCLYCSLKEPESTFLAGTGAVSPIDTILYKNFPQNKFFIHIFYNLMFFFNLSGFVFSNFGIGSRFP